MRSRRWGMPGSKRCHCPSCSTRYAAKAHGMPFAWSGSAESISWKCRCGAVEFPVWPTRPITSPARTCCPLVTTTRREVRVNGVYPCGSHDHVVPGKPGGIQASPREHQRVLHRKPGLPHDVEPLALGHAVHGPDDHAVERRMDRLPPAVAVPRPPPDQVPPQGPPGVHMEPGSVVGADQVVRVPLSEQVGPVAGDPVRGRPLDRPLAPEGKPDHDRGVELTHLGCPDASSDPAPSRQRCVAKPEESGHRHQRPHR